MRNHFPAQKVLVAPPLHREENLNLLGRTANVLDKLIQTSLSILTLFSPCLMSPDVQVPLIPQIDMSLICFCSAFSPL